MSKFKYPSEFDYTKWMQQLHKTFPILSTKHKVEQSKFINPFNYKWNVPWYQWVKMMILSLTLLPIKLACFMVTFWLAYFLSLIILRGRTEEDEMTVPLSGWRRKVALPIFVGLANLSFFICGIMDVKVTGAPIASRKEAPVIVLAPHSAFMDSFFPVWMGMASVVGKTESARSWIGNLLRLTQPILVSREDPDSRKTCLNMLKRRCCSELDLDWPQMIIFPEGTCTNRTCLIRFKTGAFVPGCPIQPVIIKWSNSVDVFTWTWDGPHALVLLWMLFSQFYVSVELQFLPVYYPSEEERNNPQIYAENVRATMAKVMQVPLSNLNYDDCRVIAIASNFNLPCAPVINELQNIIHLLLPKQHEEVVQCFQNLLRSPTSLGDWLQQRADAVPGALYNTSMYDRLAEFYTAQLASEPVDVCWQSVAVVHLAALALHDHRQLLHCISAARAQPLTLRLGLRLLYGMHQNEQQQQLVEILLDQAWLLVQHRENANQSAINNHHPANHNEDFIDAICQLMDELGGDFLRYQKYHEEFSNSVHAVRLTTTANH